MGHYFKKSRMEGLFTVLLALLLPSTIQAKAAFAHFMVGNTASFTQSDWESNILLAQAAHIDAFALNMAYGDPNNAQLATAFGAANALDFHLFFSFDYAGNGPWDQATVTALIEQYGGSSSYFQYNGQPLVSTFEGPANAFDWVQIKAQTGCFFMPSWSSLGAKAALEAGGGVADGLFSWAAWPWGPDDMDTYTDASYIQFLSGKPYMMPVSPWFYTNLPGYDKNWVWRGDHLWFDRWEQVMYLQPEFVEIITWNDYGESHYIGPLNSNEYVAFTIGEAPYNYVENMPHDGWRELLPFLIDTYKTGTAVITTEKLVVWYRTSQASACSNGDTTGNTASQLQIEYDPTDIMEDRVFFSALLTSPADMTILIGTLSSTTVTWEQTPDGGVGIYHGSFPFGSDEIGAPGGEIGFEISRGGGLVMVLSAAQGTAPFSNSCPLGITNWNCWVGSVDAGPTSTPASPPLSISQEVCIAGTGANNFAGICSFTCNYGYCPIGACVCTAMGAQVKTPTASGVQGFSANGDPDYTGLCSFACNFGYCPAGACSTTEVPISFPASSPFLQPTCTGGTGAGAFAGLCSYACNFGFCPIHHCTCTSQGPLNLPPPVTAVPGVSTMGDDSDLCNFACSRGYCPTGCIARFPGYVHFGDSYAAGLGTGTTSTDSCRVGSQNFGYLLERAFGGPSASLSFVSMACSGDEIADLTAKINTWTQGRNVNVATIGTLSIGGNDLGFGTLVQSCIITPFPRTTIAQSRETCIEAENAAYATMADTSAAGLVARLQAAYLLIMVKALDNFHLYVSGYATFFSTADTDCDLTTFYYWKPAYNPNRNDVVYLTLALRNELNALITALNTKIQEAIQNANQVLDEEGRGARIHYVDVEATYTGHRFCESSAGHEPNEDNQHNWFFLSGWGDFNPPPSLGGGSFVDPPTQEAQDIAALIAAGPIVLPSSATCSSLTLLSGDPYLQYLCDVEADIAADPNGLNAMQLADANRDIANGNVSSTSIPWYLPTAFVKTFHPRTTGQLTAYATNVITVMIAAGQLAEGTSLF